MATVLTSIIGLPCPPPRTTAPKSARCEPYVQGQTTYSIYSPRPGNTRISWLTGAAPWAYYSATQYILGLRPEVAGLRIDPCIPHDWPGFTATRRFRGKLVGIEVTNPDAVCRGVKSLTLNGELLPDNLVPADMLERRIG